MTNNKNESNINFTAEQSKKNLEYLAKQLALNHFHSSTVDLFGNEVRGDEDIRRFSKKLITEGSILKNGDSGIFSVMGDCLNDEVEAKRNENDIDVTRNILVIGAGCSFNSFENIPLATGTVDLLKENISIAELIPDKLHNGQKDQKTIKISLKYLLDFSAAYSKTKTLEEYHQDESLKCSFSNKFLKDQFINNDEPHVYNVIPEIAKKIETGMQKWRLTNLNQRNNISKSLKKKEDQIDFESFLNIIAQVLSVETVRKAMYDLYYQCEGTTLFYSIVAHLFKNRFIDVIINFNFDELLDRAIDDEIGTSGYLKVLSDGDCYPINTISKGGRLRQPLYIKPHGTSSHKSTLRFTKDQYQELPNDMRIFLSNLISGQQEKELIKKPRPVNLITAGFEMSSIEFNEILIKYLPPGSAIFDLFWHEIEDEPNAEYGINSQARLKLNHLKNLFEEVPKTGKPSIYLIAHMLYQQREECNDVFSLYNGEDILLKKRKLYYHDCSLGNTTHLLFLNICEFFKEQFKPRGIDKHLVINALFGNRLFWNQVVEKSDYCNLCNYSPSEQVSFYPSTYFKSANYFKDRTLMEALINLTVNDGKIDLFILMQGIAGYYYSKYTELSRATGEDAISILNLLQGFNFTSGDNEHSLGIRHISIERFSNESKTAFEILFENFIKGENLPFSEKFKHYLNYIDKKDTNEALYIYDLLWNCFNTLRLGDNSKIYPDFNDLGNHIFKNYNHLDVINTNLANNLQFFNALSSKKDGHKINRICIVADNGFQIGNFLFEINELLELRNGDLKIYLIIQDHFDQKLSYYYQRSKAIKRISETYKSDNQLLERLDMKYPEFLNILILPIVDHNRHLILFLEEDRKKIKVSNDTNNEINELQDFIQQESLVKHSIYYYKKGLSQKINPIHLDDDVNQKYLLQMFGTYSKKAATHLNQIDFYAKYDEEFRLEYLDKIKKSKFSKRTKDKLNKRASNKEYILETWVFNLNKIIFG